MNAGNTPTTFAAWCDRHGEALPKAWRDDLRAWPDAPLPPLAIAVLDTLLRLRADSEVQLAAILHLCPALREQFDKALAKKATGLETLLEGLRAAEQVWSLHAQRE